MNSCSPYFEPNFVEKFLWESGFSNFGHVDCMIYAVIIDTLFFTNKAHVAPQSFIT